MFPEGDVTTFEPAAVGELGFEIGNRGEDGSVGVGGVFTMIGAGLSVDGGV